MAKAVRISMRNTFEAVFSMLDTVFVLGEELTNKSPAQIRLADKFIFDS